MIRSATSELEGLIVDSTSERVVDYARRVGAEVLVRGTRGGVDDSAESELVRQNDLLAPELKTIILRCPTQEHVSSSVLRAAARAGLAFPGGCTLEAYAALLSRLRTG